MATDARISTGLPGHPKTKKLLRRLGTAGPLACIYLFVWAAANRSDGNLSGMTDEDIELSVDWGGEDGEFVAAMIDVGFLDGGPGSRCIHDWEEHNPWAAGANARSEAGKWAALCKRYGSDGAAIRMPDYAERMRGACGSDAPSPSPSPSPSPIPIPSPIPTSPSLRSGESVPASLASPAAQPKAKGRKPKSEATTLTDYLTSCKATSAKAIPEGHYVRRWAEDAGVSPEMLQIAWVKFRERYTKGEKGKGKRYKDWPAHFATAVEENWFKLWFADANGVRWTTNGLTCKAVLDARMREDADA